VTLRKNVTPMVIVALAAGAGIYAWIDRGSVSDAERAERSDDVFPAFRPEQVSRIDLVHGAETTSIARGGDAGAWKLTAPRQVKADPAAVDALVRELEFATKLRNVPESEARGVDAPRMRGAVAMGTVVYRFALGDDAPRPQGAAYMRVEGEGTFVVSRSLAVQLLRTADAYRDRQIVPYPPSEVARLEVRAGSGGFAVERAGVEMRLAGDGLRASRAAMDRVWSALAELRAEAFIDDADGDRATASPVATILLAPRDAGKPRAELVVGGPCAGHPEDVVVVRRAPERTTACAPKGALEGISPSRDALVDKHLFFAYADEIEELDLRALDTPTAYALTLARGGSSWHERTPEDRTLTSDEADSANDLAFALARGEALDARKESSTDKLVARTRATVTRADGEGTETVELTIPDANGVVLARRVEDGAILRVPLAVARRLQPIASSVRGRSIFPFGSDTGDLTALATTCSPTPQELSRRERGWTLRAPSGFDADAAAVLDLASAVTRAKADAWVADADDGTFGLRDGACTVTLTLGEDAGVRSLGITFGAPAADGSLYAQATTTPAVFVVAKAVRDVASHMLVDRSRMHLDVDSIASVILSKHDARIAFEREGDRLVRAGAADADGDAASAFEGIGGALAQVYAESALHVGPPAKVEGFDVPTLEVHARLRSDAGTFERTITLGAPVEPDAPKFYFARVSGIDATFTVPRAAADALLAGW
jgi:hypothetical protein